MKKIFAFFLTLQTSLIAAAAQAAEPIDWQFGLQPAASPVKEQLHDFHNLLLFIITGITAIVFILLFYVMIRYNKRANPEPRKFTHNTLVEVIWTAIPLLILIVIVVPSFKVLFFMDRATEPEMTLKVVGYQWYWGYEYPDHGGINFLSYMIPDEDIDESKGERRLLATDTRVVLPVDTNIQILVTAADVLHSWAVPAFGIKRDAVPGRINETWVNITEPGIYYGQCSEICGTGHAYMPIMIEAVEKDEFEAWVEEAKELYASNDNQIPAYNAVQTAAIEN